MGVGTDPGLYSLYSSCTLPYRWWRSVYLGYKKSSLYAQIRWRWFSANNNYWYTKKRTIYCTWVSKLQSICTVTPHSSPFFFFFGMITTVCILDWITSLFFLWIFFLHFIESAKKVKSDSYVQILPIFNFFCVKLLQSEPFSCYFVIFMSWKCFLVFAQFLYDYRKSLR